MRRSFALLLFAAMFCNPAFSQIEPVSTAQGDSLFRQLASIRGKFNSFSVDNLNNLYLVTNGNQLKKYNAQGDSLAVFNDVKRYGNPSLLDVSNPLKVLLYYRNYSTVVSLDRQLSPRNTLNFRNKQIFAVKAIATSYDNNIWLFDEQDFKLKKIDEEGKQLMETTDFRMLFDTVPSPVQIIDQENFVYLYSPDLGFYIFDYYGTLKNRLPFFQWENTAVSGNKLYGFRDGKLFSYEVNSLTLKEYPLPAFFKTYSGIKAMNGKVYLHNEQGIDIYQLK